MDGTRFDSLARSLAAPRTRRGLLGSLAALGAGLLGARETDAQVTQAQCGNKVCAANPGVCTDGCVCRVYGNLNSRCRPPGECGSGAAVACPPPTTTTTTTTNTTSTTAAPTTTTTTTLAPGTCGDACSPVDGVGCPAGCGCNSVADGFCFALEPGACSPADGVHCPDGCVCDNAMGGVCRALAPGICGGGCGPAYGVGCPAGCGCSDYSAGTCVPFIP